MFVRVATFESSDSVDETIEMVKSDVENDNRPPGLEDAKGMLMLVDRKGGKGAAVTFCETEEDLRKVDEYMNNMNPPSGSGTRSSVEMFEVAVDSDQL